MVVVGGGTGTFTVLRGLKDYEDIELTAIVTMADDGGSNKVLRDEFGLLPTSGVRQCVVALSRDEGLMRELFLYRYSQGMGISGMTFGNLFMAALSDIVGSQKEAIMETCRVMRVRGRILPISYDSVTLLARYEDGTEVLGEHMIDESNPKVGRQRIVSFRTVPKTRIDKEAKQAITEADVIILGPGDLYTNTIADLAVTGVKAAIGNSKAKVVFVMNLMTKLGESYAYKASDFLHDLGKYMDEDRLDFVVVNSDGKFDEKLLATYAKEEAEPVIDDLDNEWNHARVLRAPLISHTQVVREKGDKVRRSMIRHDSMLLAKELYKLIKKGRNK